MWEGEGLIRYLWEECGDYVGAGHGTPGIIGRATDCCFIGAMGHEARVSGCSKLAGGHGSAIGVSYHGSSSGTPITGQRGKRGGEDKKVDNLDLLIPILRYQQQQLKTMMATSLQPNSKLEPSTIPT